MTEIVATIIYGLSWRQAPTVLRKSSLLSRSPQNFPTLAEIFLLRLFHFVNKGAWFGGFLTSWVMTKQSFGKFVRMTRLETWKGGGREWWITDSLLSNRRRQEPLASYAMSYPAGTEHRGEAGGWRGFSSDPQCAPLMMSWSRIHLLIISQPTRQKASRIEHWHQSVLKNMIILQDKTQLNKKKTDCFKEINFCFYRLGLEHTNGGGNSALMSLNLI